MSKPSLDLLYSRRRTVYAGMDNVKADIANLEDKISRLQEASNSLESSIVELEDIESTYEGLEVDENKWKGEEKDTCFEQYETYVESIKECTTETEDVKDDIDAEIQRAETSLATAQIGLSNLESTLDSLNEDISKAEEG